MQNSQTVTRPSSFWKREGCIGYQKEDIRPVCKREIMLYSAAVSNTKCTRLNPTYTIDLGGALGFLFDFRNKNVLLPGLRSGSRENGKKEKYSKSIAAATAPPKVLVALGLPPVTEVDGMGGNDERTHPLHASRKNPLPPPFAFPTR